MQHSFSLCIDVGDKVQANRYTKDALSIEEFFNRLKDLSLLTDVDTHFDTADTPYQGLICRFISDSMICWIKVSVCIIFALYPTQSASPFPGAEISRTKHEIKLKLFPTASKTEIVISVSFVHRLLLDCLYLCYKLRGETPSESTPNHLYHVI
jgi:hypothetical protein